MLGTKGKGKWKAHKYGRTDATEYADTCKYGKRPKTEKILKRDNHCSLTTRITYAEIMALTNGTAVEKKEGMLRTRRRMRRRPMTTV